MPRFGASLPRKPTTARQQLAARLYTQGYSMLAIARRMGVSKERISAMLHRPNRDLPWDDWPQHKARTYRIRAILNALPKRPDIRSTVDLAKVCRVGADTIRRHLKTEAAWDAVQRQLKIHRQNALQFGVLGQIKRLAAKLHRTPTMSDYQVAGLRPRVLRAYGDLSAAARAAGLVPNERSSWHPNVARRRT